MSEGTRLRPARGAGRERSVAAPPSACERGWARLFVAIVAAVGLLGSNPLTAEGPVPTPEQFIGFRVGTDNKLARWDTIVAYMKLVAERSDRVQLRELGKTNAGNPFIVLEISSAETLKNLDRFKRLEHQLYFQDGAPGASTLEDVFQDGKIVVAVTCSAHATEVGATQMSLELVYRLATDNSPEVRKILDNVIFLLVPSANPDGQILVTDWFNRNLGTPFEASPLPSLYHPYAGHDINRDMYMLTQKETQYIANLMWHDWIPAIWLDEHQMESAGPRIFVMPAGDPINPNVHPLIYRWNGILGQSQAAALEASGRNGIIYNATYTNFWQGAMAWSGWWHNQIGLLTEVASVRVASPTLQQSASPRIASEAQQQSRDEGVGAIGNETLPAPSDITPRTEYLRPWMGGRWTLRDIVDYDLISTMALLDASADRREAILRQIYEVNRQTVEGETTENVGSIVVPLDGQQDPREAAHLVDALQRGGVEVFRAESAFDLEDRHYGPGALVIPMRQVFARYAKDLLERQTYPEAQRSPNLAAAPPYDVTAWSLGMLLGVNVDFLAGDIPATVPLRRLEGAPKIAGSVTGEGTTFEFEYKGADTTIAINRLLRKGARITLSKPSTVLVSGVTRQTMRAMAAEIGLHVLAGGDADHSAGVAIRSPRIALYAPWTGGNIDEGWTRWVLERYEFDVATVHNADMARGDLRRQFDAIILPDQPEREMVDGDAATNVRPEYRGGIGDAGVEALKQFVSQGGTLVTLGAASELAIDRLQVPAHNLKRGVSRDQHSGPGTILHILVDTSQPMGFGMAADSFGFYNNSPFFAVADRSPDSGATVIARYPSQHIVASGWLKGEDLMANRAAVVSIDMHPGRVVLFGLRPQHRGQTHATFPMLFNALYLSAAQTGKP